MDNFTYFFATIVMEALEAGSVSGSKLRMSESQICSLMQVIVAGLKSSHREFRALGATLLARVFPQVKLKAKIANKICKVIKKKVGKSKEDSEKRTALALLLIVLKTQHETVDKKKIRSALLEFEETISELLSCENKTEGHLGYLRKLCDTLAWLCCFEEENSLEEDTFKLLSLIKRCVDMTPGINRDTVLNMKLSLENSITLFKGMKKNNKPAWKKDIKRSISAGQEVLSLLKLRDPSCFEDKNKLCDGNADDDDDTSLSQIKRRKEKQGKPKSEAGKNCSNVVEELEALSSLRKNMNLESFVSMKSEESHTVFASILSEHGKIQKIAFDIFRDILSSRPSKRKLTEDTSLFPLMIFLLEQEKEIKAHLGNIPRIMELFSAQEKHAQLILKSLIVRSIDMQNPKMFARLAPYCCVVQEPAAIEAVADYGLKLMITQGENCPGYDEAVYAIVQTFLPSFLSQLELPGCWNFVCEAIQSPATILKKNMKMNIAVVALDIMAEISIDDSAVICKVFSSLIELSSQIKDGNILVGFKAVLASLTLKTELFVNKLSEIWGMETLEKLTRARRTSSSQVNVPNTASINATSSSSSSISVKDEDKWSKTFFLLETFLYTKGLNNFKAFLKPLFALLKLTLLGMDNWISDSAAYALDLTLSTVHSVIEQMSDEELLSVDDSAINPELLVQCIRNCKNPDTKSTALLILAKASACNAEYVLQNSIQIFTFMGSHFLKIDSRHSFHVACQAIDIIIPHIQRVCKAKSKEELRNTCLNIVTTFADASADMATHRFKAFLHKLIKCLGEKDYLFVLVLLLLRKTGKKKTSLDGTKANRVSREQILDLYSSFSAQAQVEALLQMMLNLKQDTPVIRNLLRIKKEDDSSSVDDDIEMMETDHHSDLEGMTASYKLTGGGEFNAIRLKMLTFVTALVSSKKFSNQILESLENGEKIQQQLELLIEAAILNIDVYERATKSLKMNRYLIQLSERTLEHCLSILPTNTFVDLLHGLLSNRHDLVRRKSLEVFNSKIQPHHHQANYSLVTEESLPRLLKPLSLLAKGRVHIRGENVSKEETVLNQQLALLAMRAFGKTLGGTYPRRFMDVCVDLSKKEFLRRLENPGVIASTLLCLTELVQVIGPHAVGSLPSLVEWILYLMNDGGGNLGNISNHVLLLNSVILALQKVMEHFSGFLNPYLKRLVVSSCKLSALQQHQQQQPFQAPAASEPSSRNVGNRIRNLQSSMAKGIPTHSLLTICSDCFDDLMYDTECIIALANILRENVQSLEKSQVLAMSNSCMEFFLRAFKYRSRVLVTDSAVTPVEANRVESELIAAFLSLTLKLPLDDFKPLFYR